MNEDQEFGYSICSSRGAGYYTDLSFILEADPYLSDMEITKHPSVEEAREAALAYLHEKRPDLKNRFNILPNRFKYFHRLKENDFQHSDPWDIRGHNHA